MSSEMHTGRDFGEKDRELEEIFSNDNTNQRTAVGSGTKRPALGRGQQRRGHQEPVYCGGAIVPRSGSCSVCKLEAPVHSLV